MCEISAMLKDEQECLKEIPWAQKGYLCYVVSQGGAHASWCPFAPVGPLAPLSFRHACIEIFVAVKKTYLYEKNIFKKLKVGNYPQKELIPVGCKSTNAVFSSDMKCVLKYAETLGVESAYEIGIY